MGVLSRSEPPDDFPEPKLEPFQPRDNLQRNKFEYPAPELIISSPEPRRVGSIFVLSEQWHGSAIDDLPDCPVRL